MNEFEEVIKEIKLAVQKKKQDEKAERIREFRLRVAQHLPKVIDWRFSEISPGVGGVTPYKSKTLVIQIEPDASDWEWFELRVGDFEVSGPSGVIGVTQIPRINLSEESILEAIATLID